MSSMWKHVIRKKLIVVMKIKYDTMNDLNGALEQIKGAMFCSAISAGDDGGNYDYSLLRVEIPKPKRSKHGKGSKTKRKSKGKGKGKGRSRSKKVSIEQVRETEIGVDGQGT